MTDQYALEKTWVFSFDLKEENEDREKKRVPDHRSDVLKESLPQRVLPIRGTRKIVK